jgi:hypothetical protein
MLRTGCSPKSTPYQTIWLAALILSALLAGCGVNGENDPTPAGDLVGLETLVAEAVITAKASTPSFPTGLPTGLAARTSTPTITPIPSATQPVTLMPTETLFITPTLPAAPERSPSDPAAGWGEPDWSDSFDTDENWSVFENDRAKMEISGGQLHYSLFEAGKGPTWALSWPTVTNFYLETTVLSPQECSGKDSFGIVFRSPDANQGYRFELFCDGGYRLIAFDPGSLQTLAGGFSHEAINTGPNQINRLGIWAENQTLVIYVNGVGLAGLQDNTYRAAGRFGFTINSENTEPFNVVFDYLAFWTFD